MWSGREAITSLYWTVPKSREVWEGGIQVRVTTVIGRIHDIFHVSQLKKCLNAPVDVVLPDVAPLDTDLTYPEYPIKILDQKSRVMRRKTIKFYKIQWSNHTEGEATWESEDFLRSRHPDFELS
jgi:hypothetical protein